MICTRLGKRVGVGGGGGGEEHAWSSLLVTFKVKNKSQLMLSQTSTTACLASIFKFRTAFWIGEKEVCTTFHAILHHFSQRTSHCMSCGCMYGSSEVVL